MNESIRRWCDKCKADKEFIRPSYVPPNSNVFRCSECNTKINVKLKNIKNGA